MESTAVKHDQVLIDMIEYAHAPREFSTKAYDRARLLLLDSFGCAIESLQHPAVAKMIGPYIEGTTVPHGCRLPGTSIEEDYVKAAFDFGVLIRYLDHNDCLTGVEWGHPSDNIGAIVPVMDQLCRSASASLRGDSTCPPTTVKTLLEAIIKAYDIEGCFQVANCFNAVNMDHTILVKVTSMAVLTWLCGLSKTQAIVRILAIYSKALGQAYRHKQGKSPIEPVANESYLFNVFHMMGLTSQAGGLFSKDYLEVVQRFWIAVADHELTHSTSTLLMAGSALADPLSCVISGITAGYGILHLGAIEASYRNLGAIGSVSNVASMLESVKRKETRLMGLGHRIYKKLDPRMPVVRECLAQLERLGHRDPLMDVSVEIERQVTTDSWFTSRRLCVNPDLYQAFIFTSL